MSEYVKSKVELFTFLKNCIKNTNRNIVLFGGHFPLRYFDDNRKPNVFFDVNRWGEFSTYTFELSVKLCMYAHELGKSASIIVLVDDDIELDKVFKNGGWVRSDKPAWKGNKRAIVYKNTVLPSEYIKIIEGNDFSLSHFLRQERKSKYYILFSEKRLKEEARILGFKDKKECSVDTPMFRTGFS